MKTTISFITKSGDFIYTIYDNAKDWFKVGDKLYFDTDDIYPATVTNLRLKWKEDFIQSILKDNAELQEKYGRKRWKIISKHISIKKNSNSIEKDKYLLNIEYTVKICNKFYWEWWYIKSLIKIKNK